MSAPRLVIAALAAAGAAALVVTACSGSSPPSAKTAAPHAAAATPAGAAPLVLVSIVGLPAQRQLSPGGPPLTFTVLLRNVGTRAYTDVTPVVSLAHCACTNTRLALAPAGTLRERDVSGHWHRVAYSREGHGKRFLRVVQQPGITLPPGARASFTFQVRFRRSQRARIQPAPTAIDITVVRLPSHSPLGPAPSARIGIQVSR